MEPSLPDYYELLQVHPKASAAVIKKAYRTLLAEGAHPDRGGDPALAALLTEAYRTLRDPEKRRAYDQARGPAAPAEGPSAAPAPAMRELRCGACRARNRVSADRVPVARCARCGWALARARGGARAGRRPSPLRLWRKLPPAARTAGIGALLFAGLAGLALWVAAPHLAPPGAHAQGPAAPEPYVRSAEALEQALRRDPQNARLHEKLGDLYRLQKRPAAALGEYRVASRINPDNAYLLTLQGNALSDLSLPAGAEAAYRHALRLDPEQAAAYAALGDTMAQQGRYGEAVLAYGRAALLAPSADVFCRLASAHRLGGDFEAAERCFRQALARSEGDHAALLGLGETLHELGRLDEAARYLTRAEGLKHQDAALHARLAEIYERQGQRRLAEREWRLTALQARHQPDLRARAQQALAR